ncbi:Lrp/AsnC family transcriptional regulator [Candidatus Woesearchaeota archaeon]|nr:MAG: Lrp/AsnC family transcriptional regulator [Candidatus Woesearchaeota archaeon]
MQQKLLAALRENARIPFARFAREHNYPASTVFKRYGELAPLIHRHTAIIDWSRVGLLLRRFRLRDTLAAREFLEHPAVNELLVTHRSHLLVEAVFPNMREAHDFEERLKAFDARCAVYPVIRELKREAFLCEQSALARRNQDSCDGKTV